jgi:hypothetical protein
VSAQFTNTVLQTLLGPWALNDDSLFTTLVICSSVMFSCLVGGEGYSISSYVGRMLGAGLKKVSYSSLLDWFVWLSVGVQRRLGIHDR